MARKGYSPKERADMRESIVDAAMQAFESGGGIGAVSFRSVAAILGCSYSAPYRYFSGKEELITALRARAYRWMEDALRLSIRAQDDARAQLAAVAQAYIEAGLSRPTLYALMFFELEGSDLGQRSVELKAAKRDCLGVCVDVIAAGQAGKRLPATVDALTAAHIFWIGAHGLVSLQVGGQFVMGRKAGELVPLLIQWLESGLEHHDGARIERAQSLLETRRSKPRT